MEIRDYSTGDEYKILELFTLVFKKEMSLDYWKWRFSDNPERMTMIKLMWDGDLLAGHYALFPVRLLIGDDLVLSGLSMTTMTHPKYFGKGIFPALAKALYDAQHRENQMVAVWGFPNANSHYGFIKNIQWRNIAAIPSFRIEAKKVRKVETFQTLPCKEFTAGHVEAYRKIASKFHIRVMKTEKYLSWRYLINPSNEYTLFSFTESSELEWFAVAKLFHSIDNKGYFEIDIVELCFPQDTHLLLDLFNAIIQHFSQFNLSYINCWMPLNDERHLATEKIGFILSQPVTYFGAKVLDERAHCMEEEKKWYFSMGDSDVY